MNGKGDRDRTHNRRQYRSNYDRIAWHRKPAESEHNRRLRQQEENWWREHDRVRSENVFRGQMFSAHGITTNS